MAATPTDTDGNAPTAVTTWMTGKIHRVARWTRHPYDRKYVIPVTACGTRSSRQFPSPMSRPLTDVDCKRCEAKDMML